MEEKRGGQPGGQRFKSERGEEEEVTEIDAEHENGLCHRFSNTEPEDKGSVSASCFLQHLLDDNSQLSPHQREKREESTEHSVLHVSPSSFSPPHIHTVYSIYIYIVQTPPNTVSLPLHAMDLNPSNSLLMGVQLHVGDGTSVPFLPISGLEVKGHA